MAKRNMYRGEDIHLHREREVKSNQTITPAFLKTLSEIHSSVHQIMFSSTWAGPRRKNNPGPVPKLPSHCPFPTMALGLDWVSEPHPGTRDPPEPLPLNLFPVSLWLVIQLSLHYTASPSWAATSPVLARLYPALRSPKTLL